jgi:diguanylate cyclase (GGDEF)-like protein
MQILLRSFALFAVPIALLAAAFALVFYGDALPPSLAGLKTYGPHIVFAIGVVLAAAFNRGRAVLALIVLIAAYAVQQTWLQQALDVPQARAVYAALVMLVPLNLALLALLPERGLFNRHGLLRLGAIGIQAAFIIWVVAAGATGIVDWTYQRFLEPPPFAVGHLPQAGIASVGLALAAAMAAGLITRSAISAALAGAIVAFTVAAHVPSAPVTFSIFTMAAELMVTIAVLQDSFRMAFRDELTGIPSRRALNERMAGLGTHYTIAMIDVDHFKKFNDTYGHDLGDQVLKMVAAHIAGVSGGGKAYRYGGEEFTVVFPRKGIPEAIPHLEAVRREIETYRLALRASDRPKKAKKGKREKGGWRGKNAVSVTVSIGVAERNERLATPQAVIDAADRALYRAKEKGRNQLSR